MNSESSKITKIILRGKSGQGIQLLGFVLANILKDQSFQVSLTSEYSPLVRAGNSSVGLVFAKKKIENPLIDKPDLEYDLGNKKILEEILKKFANQAVTNMTLLGVILNKLKLKLNEKMIVKHLPQKFQQENLEAIRRGYQA